MDYELRKVKCYPAMSEETEAFTAQLWENGKHIADIKNDGHGGCNDVRPTEFYTWKDIEKYLTSQMDYEISMKVIEIDETRKNQSKGFYLKSKDGKYYSAKFPMPISKLKKNLQYDAWLDTQLGSFEKQGYTVLNTNL